MYDDDSRERTRAQFYRSYSSQVPCPRACLSDSRSPTGAHVLWLHAYRAKHRVLVNGREWNYRWLYPAGEIENSLDFRSFEA